jgi:hypothetical protein
MPVHKGPVPREIWQGGVSDLGTALQGCAGRSRWGRGLDGITGTLGYATYRRLDAVHVFLQ